MFRRKQDGHGPYEAVGQSEEGTAAAGAIAGAGATSPLHVRWRCSPAFLLVSAALLLMLVVAGVWQSQTQTPAIAPAPALAPAGGVPVGEAVAAPAPKHHHVDVAPSPRPTRRQHVVTPKPVSKPVSEPVSKPVSKPEPKPESKPKSEPEPEEVLPNSKLFRTDAVLAQSRRLREKLARGGETVRIVALGGSVTAGAGHVTVAERYHSRVAVALRSEFPDTEVKVVNAGHGTRNSFFGSLFLEALMPPLETVDLILWEYSLNDVGARSSSWKGSNERDMRFEVWALLHRISAHPSPPLMAMVYLWSAPIGFGSESQLDQRSFRASHDVGLAFPFVLGYANVGQEVTDLGLPLRQVLADFVASDGKHPNAKGHALMARGLLHLLHTSWRAETAPFAKKEASKLAKAASKVDWPCGVYGVNVQRAIKNSKGASLWIAEEPRRKSALVPLYIVKGKSVDFDRATPATEEELGMISLGKSDPLRLDRKLALELPCCSEDKYAVFRLGAPKGKIYNALNFWTTAPKGTKVMLDWVEYPASKRTNFLSFPAECFVKQDHNFFRNWIIVDQTVKSPTSLALCKQACKKSNEVFWLSVLFK